MTLKYSLNKKMASQAYFVLQILTNAPVIHARMEPSVQTWLMDTRVNVLQDLQAFTVKQVASKHATTTSWHIGLGPLSSAEASFLYGQGNEQSRAQSPSMSVSGTGRT